MKQRGFIAVISNVLVAPKRLVRTKGIHHGFEVYNVYKLQFPTRIWRFAFGVAEEYAKERPPGFTGHWVLLNILSFDPIYFEIRIRK